MEAGARRKSRMLSSPRSSSRNSTTAASQCSRVSTNTVRRSCLHYSQTRTRTSRRHSVHRGYPIRLAVGSRVERARGSSEERSSLRDAMPKRLLEDPDGCCGWCKPAEPRPGASTDTTTASCFAPGSDLTLTDRCRPSHELTATCRNYAASGGCSRDRSGRLWLSKISSSPSRNGPASLPTGLSIIVSPR